MATATEWQVRLDEAEQALHLKVTGRMVEESRGPDQSSSRFAQMSVKEIKDYIEYCKCEKRKAETGMRRQPIYFSPSL